MATEAGLRFFLSADMKEFERAMKDAQTLSKQTADGIVKAGVKIASTGDYVADLNRDIRALVASMKDGGSRFVAFGSAVDKTGTITRNFTKSSGNASTALMGLTRIAQDAPFGFIAIGNNLAETVSQLGSLIKTSGGAGNALKALGSSLIGPGGVVLGLNLLITGVTVAVQKYGSLGAALDALINPLSEQAKLQKEIADTMLQGAKDAQVEITKLQSLYRATQNVNIPLSERNKIIDELQKKYPQYFGNITNEAFLAGKATTAYENLKGAILRASQARAAQDKIAEIQGRRLDIQTKLIEKSKQLAEADAQLSKVNQQFSAARKKGIGIGVGATQELDKYQSAALGLQATIASLKNGMQDLGRENNSLLGTINQLFSQIDSFVIESGTKVLFDDTAAKKLKKQIYSSIDGLNTLNDILNSGRRQDIFIKPQPIDILQPLNTALIPGVAEKYAQALASNWQIQWRKTVVPAVEISAEQLNSMLERTLVRGIGNVSSGIGKALAGGGISEVISGFVNMIAGFMEELGTLLIAQGLSIEAFKKSLQSLQGAPAIIAGAALFAAAGAFRALADKGPSSFATGGTVYGDQIARVGDNATQKEHILSDMQLRKIADGAGIGGGGDIIAETSISGNQLAIILRRAGYQISRIGG